MKLRNYFDQFVRWLGLSKRKSVTMTAKEQRQTDYYTFSFRLAKSEYFPYEAIQREIALNPWCSPSRSPEFNIHDTEDGIKTEINVWMLTASKSAQLEQKLRKIIENSSGSSE